MEMEMGHEIDGNAASLCHIHACVDFGGGCDACLPWFHCVPLSVLTGEPRNPSIPFRVRPPCLGFAG